MAEAKNAVQASQALSRGTGGETPPSRPAARRGSHFPGEAWHAHGSSARASPAGGEADVEVERQIADEEVGQGKSIAFQ